MAERSNLKNPASLTVLVGFDIIRAPGISIFCDLTALSSPSLNTPSEFQDGPSDNSSPGVCDTGPAHLEFMEVHDKYQEVKCQQIFDPKRSFTVAQPTKLPVNTGV